MAKSNQKKRRVSKHKGSMKIITLVLFILCSTMGYKTWQTHQETQQYIQMEAGLTEQIEEAREEQEAIEAQAEYQNSDEYIEELARDKFGLVYENEIIFKKQGR